MTTIEELRVYACLTWTAQSPFDPHPPITLLQRAATELETLMAMLGELQKENAELRKQIAELTVKKTQVYNPPKPSIGNFSS